MNNKKIINGRFRGLVILKDTKPMSKNNVKELELNFNNEKDYNEFLNIIEKI